MLRGLSLVHGAGRWPYSVSTDGARENHEAGTESAILSAAVATCGQGQCSSCGRRGSAARHVPRSCWPRRPQSWKKRPVRPTPILSRPLQVVCFSRSAVITANGACARLAGHAVTHRREHASQGFGFCLLRCDTGFVDCLFCCFAFRIRSARMGKGEMYRV